MTGLALPWSKVFKCVLLFLCKWVWRLLFFCNDQLSRFPLKSGKIYDFLLWMSIMLFAVCCSFFVFFWSWTLANDWISATVIQAFQRFSFLCKWVWKTSKFFVMTDYCVFQWGLLRFMILFLGCLIFYILFIVFCFMMFFCFELRRMTGLALPWSKVFKRVLFLCKWVWKTIILL